MEPSLTGAEFPMSSRPSFEARIVSTWLPLSIIGAAVLGFESWLGPRGAYYALAVLPVFPLVLASLFLIRRTISGLKTFIFFLVPYLACEWAAEIYYLWHWNKFLADPAVPSFADYCWLTSYLFLITGCWSTAFGQRGLRLQSKDAFLHGAWIAVAATILISLGWAVVASDKTPAEAIVMGLYPFFDAIVISLILVIRGRNRSEMVRAFWFILMLATMSVLVGDTMWLLSKTESGDAEALVKVGDAFYILAYFLDIVAVWVAFRIEPVQANLINSSQLQASVKQALSAGGLNSLASVPIVVVLALVFVAEKSVEQLVIPMFGAGPMPLLAVSGIVAFGLKAAFWRWEKKLDAVAMYREEFRKRFENGCELDSMETAFLERLRVALEITPRAARAIEGRILQEKEDELRARLEVIQREMAERRSAEEWQVTKSMWLASIRDLNAQLEAEVPPVSSQPLNPWVGNGKGHEGAARVN